MIFIEFLSQNYMTILIVVSLMVIRFAFKEYKIPAARLVPLIAFIVVISATTYFLNEWSYHTVWSDPVGADFEWHIRFRTIVSIIDYVIQPLYVLIELMIIVPDMKNRFLFSIPAIINTILYVTSPLTNGLVFKINYQNRFFRGPLGYTIYFVTAFYLVVLVIVSIKSFRGNNRRKGILLLFIVSMMLMSMFLEYRNWTPGYIDEASALSILIYYIYLIVVYQQELRESIAQKELKIAQDKVAMLQEQIRPHFIFNSLNVIRALIKRDPVKAAEGIDHFSDYLRAHVFALKSPELIPFDEELVNVKAFIALAQPSYEKPIDISYDLKVTDFMIPPLSLEPIVENAVKHGIGKDGGYINVSSEVKDGNYVITVENSNIEKIDYSQKERTGLGVGLENTKTRLDIQLGGTVDLNISEEKTTVMITIPVRGKDDHGKEEHIGVRDGRA